MGQKTKKASTDEMIDAAITMKMQAKQFEKEADRMRSKEGPLKKKINESMNQNRMDEARIYAEQMVGERKMATNIRKQGVKMGAMAAKLEGAVRSMQISEQMASTVPAIQNAMKQMEKSGIAKNIGEFEKVFEDMEVKTGEIDDVMNTVYS